MNVSIVVLFTIAYTVPRIVGRPQLFRIASSIEFVHLVVSLNIAIWTLISLWRMYVELGLLPLMWRGLEFEFVSFGVAFLGLHLLNFVTRWLNIRVGSVEPPASPVLRYLDMPLFGAMEEIIWRGYVLNALGGFTGYVVSSVGFGLHHVGSSFRHFLWATVAGFILGGVYSIFGGLWGVFLAHGLYNLTVLLMKR